MKYKKKNFKIVKKGKFYSHFAPMAVKFLDGEAILNLMIVAQNDLSTKKSICSNILKTRTVGNKTRVSIWKVILEVPVEKSEYSAALKAAEEIKPSVREIIHLDVVRTFFDTDVSEKRDKAERILQAIAHKHDEVNYCQGMNFIVAFLFELIDDEQSTFDLMDGLFSKTEFKLIFENDLNRLKTFFNVFERLGKLYLPEVFNSFKYHGISVNYFCSPWFLTLCTNYSTFTTGKPLAIIRIWDEFVLKGWKAIFKLGVLLLKKYEYDILSLKYEDLLNFLLNSERMKKEFFNNDNFTEFNANYSRMKLESGLLKNLENEIELEEKHKGIDKLQKNTV